MVHLCTSWSPDSRKCRAASKKESPTVNLPPIRQKRKYKDYSMIAHFSAQARKLWPLDLSASLCALSKMLWVRCHEKMYYRRMPSITLSVNDDGKAGPAAWRQIAFVALLMFLLLCWCFCCFVDVFAALLMFLSLCWCCAATNIARIARAVKCHSLLSGHFHHLSSSKNSIQNISLE